MDHQFQFQNLEEAAQVALLHPDTLRVLHLVQRYWPADLPICINEIARGPASKDWNPASWHCQPPPFRAVDLRLQGVLAPDQANRVKANVEAHVVYDPERPDKPVVLIHEPYHMHLQTHPRTVWKR